MVESILGRETLIAFELTLSFHKPKGKLQVNVTKLVTYINHNCINNHGEIKMDYMIIALNKNERVKIYRWLQRNKAFRYFINGKNYSTMNRKTIEQINKRTLNDNSFAECEGNIFFIDLHDIDNDKELVDKLFNYLCGLLDNDRITIKQTKAMNKERLKYLFDKREINPDCERCPMYMLYSDKHGSTS